MATYDYPSELVHRIPFPVERRGSRSDSRDPALAVEGEKQRVARPDLQAKEVGEIFYFIEPRPRNPWAASGSIAFLSLLLLAVIVVPLYVTEPLPKMERLTMLYLQPPAAAGSSSVKLSAPTTSKPTYIPSNKTLFAPVHPTQEAQTVPAETNGGVVGGVPGGVVGGVGAGMLSSVLATPRSVPVLAKTPEPVPAKRVRVPSTIAEANLIHDVPPQYPSEAGRARIQGTVVLMAVIGKDGTVKDVTVESGLPILAQAAIDAVKQWRYKPYLIDGNPVEVDSRITINFTLSS